ncbi:YchJ family protein [Krasilnikovia sp. M28-CT-15]|uniref:YchJ family protein n=1 Tax=Krasilnikovia sp. M28-CT-15 TaxID=3373540 RepID=UPI0038776AC0
MARRTARRPAPRPTDGAAPCPCGLGLPYSQCCGPAHHGHAPASAEALMRARYSAYARDDDAYVLASWHPETRPAQITADRGPSWVRLEVLDTTGGGMFDAEGTVEFRAHYRDHGRPGELYERSRFVRHDGHWVYWGPVRTDGGLAHS